MKIIPAGENFEAAIDESFGKAGPATTTSVTDTKKVTIDTRLDAVDLPSGAIFYASDDVSFRPFKFREYASLSAAQASNSFRSLAEAICATILNFDGMDLTFGDFQFIMYRHRTQMNRPFEIEWDCEGEEHNTWAAQGWRPTEDLPRFPNGQQPIDPKRIRQIKTLTSSQLQITKPDDKALAEIVDDKCMISEGLYLFPTTVRDSIQFGEDRESLIEDAAERGLTVAALKALMAKVEFASTYAMILNPDKHGATIEERKVFLDEWFEALPPEQHFAVLEKLDKFSAASEHSVSEKINTKCEVCGHRQSISIAFNPTDFFPDVPARGSA